MARTCNRLAFRRKHNGIRRKPTQFETTDHHAVEKEALRSLPRRFPDRCRSTLGCMPSLRWCTELASKCSPIVSTSAQKFKNCVFYRINFESYREITRCGSTRAYHSVSRNHTNCPQRVFRISFQDNRLNELVEVQRRSQ